MMSPTVLVASFADPPPQWGIDPVEDQSIAGALAWSYGEPVALLIVLVFASRWRRDEEKMSSAATAAQTAQHDDELESYNRFLRQLGSSR